MTLLYALHADKNNANVRQSAELSGCGLKKPKKPPAIRAAAYQSLTERNPLSSTCIFFHVSMLKEDHACLVLDYSSPSNPRNR